MDFGGSPGIDHRKSPAGETPKDQVLTKEDSEEPQRQVTIIRLVLYVYIYIGMYIYIYVCVFPMDSTIHWNIL